MGEQMGSNLGDIGFDLCACPLALHAVLLDSQGPDPECSRRLPVARVSSARAMVDWHSPEVIARTSGEQLSPFWKARTRPFGGGFGEWERSPQPASQPASQPTLTYPFK